MKLCSITITSSTRAAIIGDALRSVVGWVDACLIVHIPSAFRPDQTLDVAREVAGDKLIIHPLATMDGGYAAWRNAGLEEATRLGFDWACILDTDERVLLNGVDPRSALGAAEAPLLGILPDTGEYTKTRFIRLKEGYRYVGEYHEYIDADTPTLPAMRFHELPKTPEQIRQRLEHGDIPAMEKAIKTDPENPRWHQYLANALEILDRWDEAYGAYQQAIATCSNGHLTGWLLWKSANCLYVLKRFDEALCDATSGLAFNPGLAELHWAAGASCLNLGRAQDAIAWARSAIAHGHTTHGGKPTRVGLLEPAALYEGPFTLLEKAYGALGDKEQEAWAREQAEAAVQARECYQRGQA